jgi:hypothetical protein
VKSALKDGSVVLRPGKREQSQNFVIGWAMAVVSRNMG